MGRADEQTIGADACLTSLPPQTQPAGSLAKGECGLGVGVGAGAPLGKQLGESLNVASDGGQDAIARLQTLKKMFDEKLITQEEFDARKKAILDSV